MSDRLDAAHSANELQRVVAETPRWTPGANTPPARGGDSKMRFTLLGDLLDEPEETTAWLIEGRLPMGGISLLAGKPKAGKRALEEKRAEVRRHFRAMGAHGDEDVRFFIAPSPEDGLRQLREATERERPVLIVVDPLLRFVRVRDANDYAVVTAALEPLVTLAPETGARVLAVHHEGS